MKIAGVGVLALCASCATIMKGSSTDVTITSPTPGAEVSIRSKRNSADEVYSGPAPAKTEVRKGEEYTVIVSAPGYKPRTFTLEKGFQGWTVGNLIWILPIFWGVGVAVDAMDGAMWTLSPEHIDAPLVAAPAPPPTPAPPPASAVPAEPTKPSDYGTLSE